MFHVKHSLKFSTALSKQIDAVLLFKLIRTTLKRPLNLIYNIIHKSQITLREGE